jgi:hypothetical protein
MDGILALLEVGGPPADAAKNALNPADACVANLYFSHCVCEMRPMGFDSADLCRLRSGLALSRSTLLTALRLSKGKARKRRVEAPAATVAAEAGFSQAAFGL